MLIKVELIETGKTVWIDSEKFNQSIHKGLTKPKPKARKKNANTKAK